MTFILLLPLCVVLLIASWNLLSWRRLQPTAELSLPLTVLIPARNEAARIPALLTSLIQQDGLKKVIVCNDHSTDDTAEVVRRFREELPQLQLIDAPALPPGWVGKNHATQTLLDACEEDDENLVFLDADVRLEPGALNRFAQCLADDPDAVHYLLPRQGVSGFWDGLGILMLLFSFLSWLPLEQVNRSRDRRFAVACGQVWLVKKKLLLQADAFKAIAGEVVDDMALARRVRDLGGYTRFEDAAALASCRMYQSFRDVWRGFSKNLAEGLGSTSSVIVCVVLIGLVYLLPLGLFISAPGPLTGTALGALLALSLVVTLRFYLPLWLSPFLPLSALLGVAIAVNSNLWALRGVIQWADRSYAQRSQRIQLTRGSRKRREWTVAFQWLARRQLRSRFSSLSIFGLEEARGALSQEGLVLASNHVCYWDALVMLVLEKELGGRAHALMDAQQLAEAPFFA
ncbi:MAG: glycosyltransferase family 2 protein, partial [Polyangiaceae bacterium]|nr:glycosyltransferase family 2 protein [Polyangiaceae bacterium]